jgi:hypothetical protein
MCVRQPGRLAVAGTILAASCLFAANQATAQDTGSCKWGEHLRVSILFDNSGTVVYRDRSPLEASRQWLLEIEKSLRPKDHLQIFGLLPRRNSALPLKASMDIPGDLLRMSELSDSAIAFTRRLFDPRSSVDTTDLTESLRQLQSILDRNEDAFCSDIVLLVTDGSLSPFRDDSGGVINPSIAINEFAALITTLRRGKGPRSQYYAVSIGASRAPAVDSLYRRKWEQQQHGTIPADLFEMQGDELLDRAFGRVYDLSLRSVVALVYREATSVYASVFALQHEQDVPLSELADRRMRYLLIEEGVTDSTSLCETTPAQIEDGVSWTTIGSHCMLHMSKLSGQLLRRLGGKSPWYSFSQEIAEIVTSDTISDPHQIVLQDVGSSSTSGCSTRDLFSAANTTGWNDANSSTPYSLRYQLSRGSASSWFGPVKLRHLPHSSCLVAANLTDSDPFDASYTEIRLNVEADDGRPNRIIFSTRRPWVPSNLVEWKLENTRSLVSSLVFIDRWIVSGEVWVRTAPDSSTTQVYIGQDSFPLRTSNENTCSRNTQPVPGGLQCLHFAGLYVGAAEPSLALIKLVPECDRQPRNCHFAALVPSRIIFRLPVSGVLLWFLVGCLVQFVVEAAKLKSWDLTPMLRRDELGARVLRVASIGLLFVWFAEAMLWTPESASTRVKLAETIIPGLIGISALFCPAQVRPLLRIIGWM